MKNKTKKLNLNFKKKNNAGSYIILSEPSETMKKIYNESNWVDKTKKMLKQFSVPTGIIMTSALPMGFSP